MTGAMRGRPQPWARLTLAAKQAEALERMREPPVTCPVCETQTGAADLAEHMRSRCPGPREPHPRGLWVTWSAARALGVPCSTLGRWIDEGRVRFRARTERTDDARRGRPPTRVYYLRDVVRAMAFSPTIGRKGR